MDVMSQPAQLAAWPWLLLSTEEAIGIDESRDTHSTTLLYPTSKLILTASRLLGEFQLR